MTYLQPRKQPRTWVRDDGIEYLFRILDRGNDRPVVAGIAEENVDLSPGRDRALDIVLHLVGLGDVGRNGDHPARVEAGGGSLELTLIDIDQGDLRAFLQQQPDTGQADAPGTAGHDAHLSVDLTHDCTHACP